MVEFALSVLVLSALPPDFMDTVAEFWRLGDPDAVDRGMLVFEADDGSARGLAAHGIEVEIDVRGFMAETRVRQTFRNPTDRWLEATYVHPLPEAGAVESLMLRIGDRVIEGQILEKAAARRIYAAARARGQAASLLEQIRPNLFRTRVANIPPHGEVDVELTIRELLHFDDGAFSYRYPIPVTPRFTPAASPPAEQPTAWISGSAYEGPRIQVAFRPGLAPAWTTTSHTMAPGPEGLEVVEPSSAQDFVLRWAPEIEAESLGMGFRESFEGEAYVAMMVVPPRPDQERRGPREITFVIDTSGSMSGPSIGQAKRALRLALGRLDAQDCFEIVRFSDHAEALFGRCRPASRGAVEQAAGWVSGLQAGGGTNMAPALRMAMVPSTTERLKQIVFITDGAVGNEPALLSMIRGELGGARLFTVGIGAAPNAAFMRDAARFGRGSFSFIGQLSEVESRISELLAKLEKPSLTDVGVDWGSTAVDQVPARIPDVYAGEPMLLVARLPAEATTVVASTEPTWSRRIALEPANGVHRLWARRKVQSLTDAMAMGESTAGRAEVLRLGLLHGIVTPYTSFVAVESQPIRPEDAPLRHRAVPTPTPGRLPTGGTGYPWLVGIGLVCIVVGRTRWRAA